MTHVSVAGPCPFCAVSSAPKDCAEARFQTHLQHDALAGMCLMLARTQPQHWPIECARLYSERTVQNHGHAGLLRPEADAK